MHDEGKAVRDCFSADVDRPPEWGNWAERISRKEVAQKVDPQGKAKGGRDLERTTAAVCRILLDQYAAAD